MYAFAAGESVEGAVRRIATEQIEEAIGNLTSGAPDLHEGVHEARKRFKKVRALLRLVRPALGDRFPAENARFREFGALLSGVRDAAAMVECVDGLRRSFPEPRHAAFLQDLRLAMVERRHRHAEGLHDLGDRVARVLEGLEGARGAVEAWPLGESGPLLIAPGFAVTYRDGRKEMRRAFSTPTDVRFHEWRKRVKDHWYHVRLLTPLRPRALRGRSEALKALSDRLGEEHDLAALGSIIGTGEGGRELPEGPGPGDGILRFRRTELRRECRKRGRRLYGDPPRVLSSWLGKFWGNPA